MRDSKRVSSLLDTPLFNVPQRRGRGVTLEGVLYAILGLTAVVATFANLGARAMSHDESLHSLYSWLLYVGEGFEHDPRTHGPFLFHINALFFALFGVSDYTARMSAATFGVVLVLLPALLRRELGRVGALVASTLTLISPSTLFYARYIRNDIYMMVWAALMTAALFRYLDSGRLGWLYLGALAVSLAMCSKETAYITGFIGLTFILTLMALHVLSGRALRVLALASVVLLVALALVFGGLRLLRAGQPGDEGSAIPGRLDEVTALAFGILASILLSSTLIRRREELKPALRGLAEVLGAATGLVALCAAGGGAAWLASGPLSRGVQGQSTAALMVTILRAVLAIGGTAAGGYAWWGLLRRARARGWLTAGFDRGVVLATVALVVIPFVVLHTTFFTNLKGLETGTVGAIRYWLAQQAVKRGSQPWYYYLIIAPLYEFLPIGLGLLAIAYYALTGRVDRAQGSLCGRPQVGERAAEAPTLEVPVQTGCDQPSATLPFVAYCVYWTLSAWLIYSWAGEKMPWMMVHLVQPMVLLSGRFVDDLTRGLAWRQVWRRGGALLGLLVPLSLWAAGTAVVVPLFGGFSWTAQKATRWALALLASAGSVGAALWIGMRLGRRAGPRIALFSVLAVGALFTIRYAWMACYINYDTAKEFLVYAHSTPDVKRTIAEIKTISRRLYGDKRAIKVAYSKDVAWPFEWYLARAFPNRVYFGQEPTRERTNVPVLIVGRPEIPLTEPLLGDRYYRFDRKYLWFPHQDYYMNLSLAVPRKDRRDPEVNYFFLDMLDPVKRRAFWDVLFYRRYAQSLADWEPSNPGKFAFYVRKDVYAEMWDYRIEGQTDRTYAVQP